MSVWVWIVVVWLALQLPLGILVGMMLGGKFKRP